ncbi:MAG: MFS transporter [Ruminococcaceae bacterium]|nr:MFS transporter [Oscillospiraceae bacterium]
MNTTQTLNVEDGKSVKKRNRAYGLLIFASFFLYIVLTGAKNLYIAEKTTLYSLGTFGNLTDLAVTMEYYFYTYAAMQVLLIFLIKKINIKWYLTVTLGLSALITVLMSFTGHIHEHYLLYTFNGFLQAGIWGCSIKVLGRYLPARLLPLSNQLMASGPAVAGALSYGGAAMFGDRWQLPFLVLGILLFFAVALYFFSVTYVSRFPQEVHTHSVVNSDGSVSEVSDEADNDFIHLKNRKRIVWFYVFSVIGGVALTATYFAVNNNLDVFLKEIGGFSNDVSKWLTVSAPLMAALGPVLIVKVCEWHKNFITVCAACFAAALLVMGVLVLFFEVNTMLSLVLLVLYLVIVNGGRSISLSVAALRMRERIDVGVYTTLINAAASIVAGLAPKLITSILDKETLSTVESWQEAFITVFLWNLAIVVFLVLMILTVKLLNRRDRRREERIRARYSS